MNKEAWIQCALNKGIEGFEIYQSEQKGRSITWFEGEMEALTTSNILGTSIRGIYHGNMAHMALEKVEDEAMDSVLDSLIEQAENVTSEDLAQLRKPEKFEEVSSHRLWVEPSVEQIKETLSDLEKKIAAYDQRVIQVASLGWEQSSGTRTIINSFGLNVEDHDCVQYLVASVVVSENGVVKDDYKIEVIENLALFDQESFVKDLCEKALFKLKATSMPSRQLPVILSKEAMTSLFNAFMGLFNGDLIYKGISPIKNRLNEAIFSKKITIIDNPKNTDCLSIANFDDEGCPTQRTVLVHDGIFTNMLLDTKSANRLHLESTGNGFKSGYASNVSVQPMNCCIQPGTKSFEKMCQEMKDGLVIDNLQGLHCGIDFVSTNFSLQCSGYLIKDGKKDKAIQLITIADSFLNLMNKVIDVGSDLDWQYHQVASPSIRFSECAISGE